MRSLLTFVLAVALLLLAVGSPSVAVAGDPDAVCACKEGYGACQHYLKAPWGCTVDPCYCDRCRNFSQHDGKTVPDGMNTQCFTSARVECYLKRHSMAWHLACSECAKNEKCCPLEKKQNCPDCESDTNPLQNDDMGRPLKETVLKRLAAEQRFFKKPDDVVVIYNRHFYLVIDVGGCKVKMQGGGARVFNNHDYAHLMIERAEYARKEFVEAFGEPKMSRPLGVYLTDRERDSQAIAANYLRGARANVLKGGGSTDVSDGMCWSGVVDTAQKAQPDEMLHFSMRHLIGHALISNWPVTDPSAKALPIWIDEGISHWLARCQDRFRDMVVWCANEGTPLSGSGKGWDADVGKLAAGTRIDPFERLMGKTSVGQLDIDDHKRCWSYFDVFLREWKDPFVKLISELRVMKEPRDAFMQNLQCTPEIFDERWRERVTGRRRSVSPDVTEKKPEENDSPSARERRAIRAETEPTMLAARVRALGTIDDPKTVDVVMDQFAKNSELVRETCLVSLLKIKDAECQERIWNYGLVHPEGMVRAYAARACGKLGLEFAMNKLRVQVAEDRHWLARAEAGVALALLKDADSMAVMRKMVNNDPAEKAQLAAMDALGFFGEDAQMAVPLILKQLESGQWQLRVGACQALGKIGSMEAVDTLVSRMEQEQGRVREEIRDALKAITYDDLGIKPENWRKWWDREKANTPGGGLPKRPEKPKEEPKTQKKDPNEKYGEVPKYYGIELYSSRIGFVLDTSLSMAQRFEPEASAAAALSRTYTGGDKLTICKEEIAQALKTLDPRAHFSVIVFNTQVRAYKKNPIPASAGNIDGAVSWIRGLPPAGETNYYDGLRAALDLDESPDDLPNFRSTPDTLTFLTDGSPTRGEITDRDTILEWYTSLNRYARIRTHVICFGSTDVDLVLLKGMAERNGGKFVQVPAKQ